MAKLVKRTMIDDKMAKEKNMLVSINICKPSLFVLFFVCLFVCLSVCLFVCLLVCLFVCLFSADTPLTLVLPRYFSLHGLQ